MEVTDIHLYSCYGTINPMFYTRKLFFKKNNNKRKRLYTKRSNLFMHVLVMAIEWPGKLAISQTCTQSPILFEIATRGKIFLLLLQNFILKVQNAKSTSTNF